MTLAHIYLSDYCKWLWRQEVQLYKLLWSAPWSPKWTSPERFLKETWRGLFTRVWGSGHKLGATMRAVCSVWRYSTSLTKDGKCISGIMQGWKRNWWKVTDNTATQACAMSVQILNTVQQQVTWLSVKDSEKGGWPHSVPLTSSLKITHFKDTTLAFAKIWGLEFAREHLKTLCLRSK